MSVIDRLRIEYAVTRYDFWLEGYDVYYGERRAMRRELRANLLAAAENEGVTAALDGLGSIRALARDQAGDRSDQPRWSRAAWAAGGVFSALVLWSVFLATAWMDGAEDAAAGGQRVTGHPTLAPWVEVDVTQGADGRLDAMSATIGLGWLLLVALAVFLLVARPWRLVTSRRGSRAAGRVTA